MAPSGTVGKVLGPEADGVADELVVGSRVLAPVGQPPAERRVRDVLRLSDEQRRVRVTIAGTVAVDAAVESPEGC